MPRCDGVCRAGGVGTCRKIADFTVGLGPISRTGSGVLLAVDVVAIAFWNTDIRVAAGAVGLDTTLGVIKANFSLLNELRFVSMSFPNSPNSWPPRELRPPLFVARVGANESRKSVLTAKAAKGSTTLGCVDDRRRSIASCPWPLEVTGGAESPAEMLGRARPAGACGLLGPGKLAFPAFAPALLLPSPSPPESVAPTFRFPALHFKK